MYLYQYLQAWLASHIKREEGQSMVEYGLILVLIAVVVIGALTLMGGNTRLLHLENRILRVGLRGVCCLA